MIAVHQLELKYIHIFSYKQYFNYFQSHTTTLNTFECLWCSSPFPRDHLMTINKKTLSLVGRLGYCCSISIIHTEWREIVSGVLLVVTHRGNQAMQPPW